MSFRLKKEEIFLIYQDYLFGKEKPFAELENTIERKLKEGWSFERLPPLEKAVLIFSIQKIKKEKKLWKPIIDQVINFSKVYLEQDHYKYINKVIDLIIKDENNALE